MALQQQNEQLGTTDEQRVQEPTESYNLVILGSGVGSSTLSWAMAKAGERVAVIERQYIGGSCPNIACLPSKNVIHSAKVASYFNRGTKFGMSNARYEVDMVGVRERKRTMVAGFNAFELQAYQDTGVDFTMGEGVFLAPKLLQVSLPKWNEAPHSRQEDRYRGGNALQVGAIPGLAESRPMTHVQALELDVVPEHLVVVGGGYVGLEFNQAMRRFGSRVTLIVRNDRLLPLDDEDVSEGITALLVDEGVQIFFNTDVKSVSGESGKHVALSLIEDGKERLLVGSHLLVATGRTPNTENIGLKEAGVVLTEHGYIKVNERLETTASDVWAIGEWAGSPAFMHIAFDDFRLLRDNFAVGSRVNTGRQVPFCLFLDPEFAQVGLNETQAKQQGIPYRLAKQPMALVLRTHTLSETRGFMKVLIDAKTDQILGFVVLGVSAGEIMGAVQIAMIGRMPYTLIRDAVLTHPTLLEGLGGLFASVPPSAHSA